MRQPFCSFLLPYAAVMKDSPDRSPFLMERRYSEDPDSQRISVGVSGLQSGLSTERP